MNIISHLQPPTYTTKDITRQHQHSKEQPMEAGRWAVREHVGQCRGQAGLGQWEHREPYPLEWEQLLNPTAVRSGSAAARYVASVQTVHAELQGLCAPVPLDRLILAVSPCLGWLPLQGYSRAVLRKRMWLPRQEQTHTSDQRVQLSIEALAQKG